MHVKLFTLRWSAASGGFDDEPLQRHLGGRDVLAFREHLFTVADEPRLLCVVVTQQVQGRTPAGAATGGAVPAGNGTRARSPQDREDPAADLAPQDRALFERMRRWRARTAHEEGVPCYVILTNRELRAIVERKPRQLAGLQGIPGIGERKVKRHGQRILEELHGKPVAIEPAPAALDAEEVA